MVTYKQDSAPAGGYGPFEWAKRAPKRMFSGVTQIAGFVAFTTVAWVGYMYHRKYLEILKHYRKNRDEENDLMKDVEGWKTGTLWGEPVYHNVRDRYIEPSLEELIVHMNKRDKRDFLWDKLYR